MPEPISFGALVGLMVLGSGEPDSVRGQIRSVGEGEEQRLRLARRGGLSRVENLDGTVRRIDGADAMWFRGEQGEMVCRPHERGVHYVFAGSPIGGLDVGGERPSWSRWDGTDFTRPTGPVTSTQFLGRAAYAVELAPPSHKPAPLQLVVDAATGLVLRSSNRHFGTVTEWTDVEIGAELADELFYWDGPAVPAPSRAERDAEHEHDMAQRRRWLDARGIADLPIPLEPTLLLNQWDDDTGACHVTLETDGHGSLIRRPCSADRWTEAEHLGWQHVYRWSDERWDWCLAGDFVISDEQLSLLKVRLATTT
jgi:hypothetical protein